MNERIKQRWQKFKANKRGFYAFIVFCLVLVLTSMADFIANDKPIVVYYDGKLYFPIFEEYPETVFGGTFKTTADYKDPYLQKKINEKGFFIMPLIEYSYDTINYNLPTPAPSAPTRENWLGTDDLGRDVLARLIYGMRCSLLFGLLLTVLSSAVGIFVGALQGYFGGRLDLFAQRFLEIWGSLPQLFVLIIVSSLIVPGFWTLLFVLLLFSWTALVPVVRAEFLRARNFDYVRAAYALGVPHLTIIFRHVFPNAMVATLTYLPFILSGAVVSLTALDFLGFGLPPGSPSLGDLVRQGKENLQAPWLAASAFVSLAFLLTALVFIGEAVRDAFDPRKNK
ncbi:MAG: ABC transporter permease [Alphaproteobacteria bacterium]|nr:ABC transporter permease [Alphaproteobacteria bacterium]